MAGANHARFTTKVPISATATNTPTNPRHFGSRLNAPREANPPPLATAGCPTPSTADPTTDNPSNITVSRGCRAAQARPAAPRSPATDPGPFVGKGRNAPEKMSPPSPASAPMTLRIRSERPNNHARYPRPSHPSRSRGSNRSGSQTWD